MTDQPKRDIWSDICARAGIDREEGEIGYPDTLPYTTAFDWKSNKFEVGQPCPLMTTHKVFAIFEDENVVRVYAVPEEKSAKLEDNLAIRWTLRTTNPLSSVTRFLSTDTLFDALAAELVEYAHEFDEVLDGEEEPEETEVQPPMAAQPTS
jgi:hypothetical protein